MEPKTIYLKDYRPYPFSISSIELTFDVQESLTTVNSRLHLFKLPEFHGQRLNLELQGENMQLSEPLSQSCRVP